MTLSNNTSEFRVFPYLDSHHKSKESTYVFIRIASKKNRNKTMDIPVYLTSGVRLKLKPSSFEEGVVKKGYYPEQQQKEFNERIGDLWLKMKNFVSANPTATKNTIEIFIYGSDFLQANKRFRKTELYVPVSTEKQTAYYHELRNQYHKRTELITTKEINADGFEVIKTQQIIIDPLDVEAVDFPKHFPKDIYEKYAAEYLNGKPETDSNKWLIQQWILLRFKPLLYESQVSDYKKIEPEVLAEFKKRYNQDKVRKYSVTITKAGKVIEKTSDTKRILDITEYREIEKLTPKERYEKGHYDKTNIFDVVGQLLFLNNPDTSKPFSDNWKGIVSRLFDYRSRSKPVESISDFTVEWISGFLMFLKTEGYSTARIVKFNPFKYNSDIYKNGGIDFYNDLSLEKIIKNTKEVFRYLTSNEHLPIIPIDKIKYSQFNLNNVVQETKKEFYLTKNEIDHLFKFEFTDSDKFSSAELSKGRDLFILQFWLGGLRPNELYDNNVTILDDGKGLKKVHYYISKNDEGKDNENPICSYSDLVLKKYNYDFNKVLIDYTKYCDLLKHIAKQVFTRTIVHTVQNDGKKKKVMVKLSEAFESYFARRSFQQVLKEEANLSDYEIKDFTGHKKTDIQGHYTTYTIKKKREIMEKIKPE